VQVLVIDRDGDRHTLEVPDASVLMETLRLPDYGVAAICGGMMACATCHVYVAERDLPRLPSQSSDEIELLEGLSGLRPTSRLSCQIVMMPALEGIELTIAPEE